MLLGGGGRRPDGAGPVVSRRSMVAPRPVPPTHPGTGRESRRGGAGVTHNDTDVRSSPSPRSHRTRDRDARRPHDADRGAGGPAGPRPRGRQRRLAPARSGRGRPGHRLVGPHPGAGPLRGGERRLPRARLPRPHRRRGAAHQRPDRAGLLLLRGVLVAALDPAGAARAARRPRRGGLPHRRRDRRGAGAARLLAGPVPLLPRRRPRGRPAGPRGGSHARRVPGPRAAGRGGDPGRGGGEDRAVRAHLRARAPAAVPRPAPDALRATILDLRTTEDVVGASPEMPPRPSRPRVLPRAGWFPPVADDGELDEADRRARSDRKGAPEHATRWTRRSSARRSRCGAGSPSVGGCLPARAPPTSRPASTRGSRA